MHGTERAYMAMTWCWTCEEVGCNIQKCKKPKNQTKTKHDMEKYYKEKAASEAGKGQEQPKQEDTNK